MRRFLFAATLFAAIAPAAVAAAQTPTPDRPPAPSSPAPALVSPRARASAEAFDAALAEILARPGGLTAGGAAELAVKNANEVARKRAETEQVRTQLGAITVALVPITKLSAQYTRLSEVDPLMFGPNAIEIPSNTYHLGVEVAVPVTELVMKLPRARKGIEAQVAAGELQIDATAADVGTQAQLAYYEWVRASLGVVAARRQVEQVEATRAQIAALVEVQRASRADLMQLDAQKAQAELGLARLQQLVVIREEQLRIRLGVGPETPLAIGEDVRLVATGDAPESAPALTDRAIRTRLEGRALDAGRRALAHKRAEAEVERLPKLNLFAQAFYDNPNQREFARPAEFSFGWAAGVQLSWSLNGFLGVKPTVKAIDAQDRALATDRRLFELGVRGQITAARSAIDLADAAYAASQRGLAAAEESYHVRLDLFENDRATALEVSAAETALTAARIAAIDALIDRRVASTQLRHAAGLDLP